jgi:hypothetical protein
LPSRTWKIPQPLRPIGSRHSRIAAVVKYVLHDANHLGGCKLSGKHRLDGSATFNPILSDLMVDRIFMVEGGNVAGAAFVERRDPPPSVAPPERL